MDAEQRSKYADYLADALNYASTSTGLQWPEETIIVAKSYSEYAEIDEIMGIKVYVMDMPSSFDFFVAFPAQFEIKYRLQHALLEYLELYPIR